MMIHRPIIGLKIRAGVVCYLCVVLMGCTILSPEPTPIPTATPRPLPPLQFESVAYGVFLLTDLEFLPNGDLLATEQDGQLLRIGEFDQHTLIHQFDVSRGGFEDGLLGMALDPDFAQNNLLYTHHIAPDADGNPKVGQITRHTLSGDSLENSQVILELPAYAEQQWHFGGGLTFGPDGYLYMNFGDTNQPYLARDPQTPHAAVLRFTKDGEIPADNPFEASLVYAYGLRNGFGLAWHPETQLLYSGENGDSCDDELNLITKGADYGWGLHEFNVCPYPDDATKPLKQWTPTISPTDVLFYTADLIPEFQNKLLMCAINTNHIHLIEISFDGGQVVTDDVVNVDGRDFFCQAALAQGPDGWLYSSTKGEIFRIGR